jgi:uncharacterized RDD family membrane protein YckC
MAEERPGSDAAPAADLPPFAPLGRRIAAGLLDLVPTLGLLGPPTAWLGQGGFVLGLVLAGAYFAVLESHDGRSLGKRALGLRVLHLDGRPCTRLGAVLRNAFRAIDGFAFYLVAVVAIAGSRRRQRLGDQVAGTSVFVDP